MDNSSPILETLEAILKELGALRAEPNRPQTVVHQHFEGGNLDSKTLTQLARAAGRHV